jgi:hypothetical protein
MNNLKKTLVLWISMREFECKLQGVRSHPWCHSEDSRENEPEVCIYSVLFTVTVAGTGKQETLRV